MGFHGGGVTSAKNLPRFCLLILCEIIGMLKESCGLTSYLWVCATYRFRGNRLFYNRLCNRLKIFFPNIRFNICFKKMQGNIPKQIPNTNRNRISQIHFHFAPNNCSTKNKCPLQFFQTIFQNNCIMFSTYF